MISLRTQIRSEGKALNQHLNHMGFSRRRSHGCSVSSSWKVWKAMEVDKRGRNEDHIKP